MDICPCGSNTDYASCCGPLIQGKQPAGTAEQLMRSRYSAYVRKEIPYILTSLHPDHRSNFDEKSTREWAENAEWLGIRILKTTGGGADDSEGRVEFAVDYAEQGIRREHREVSRFGKKDGIWYFIEGKTLAARPVVRANPKTGRNDACPCGSGRKFKKCCGT